jgi:cyclomaltodextrinase
MTESCQSWPAPAWVPDAIFYEIFPDRFYNGDPDNDPPGTLPWGGLPTRENFFGGDLRGIVDRLPYLEELGINALYLTPIFPARTNHRYDVCDYLEVDPVLGSLGLAQELVQDAHARGIRVLLDAVFNHCGNGFWAFEDLRKRGASSPYRDWFTVASLPIVQDPPNYVTCGGASYLPKLNTRNPETRAYLLRAATFWLEQVGIDGWRLDVPWKVPLDFWREFRTAVKQVNPEAYVVGEVWRDSRTWLNGDTFDGPMNYRLRDLILDYCVHDAMDGEDFDFELGLLRENLGPAGPYTLNLLGSHDTPRILTLCQENVDRAVITLTFLMTYIGAPMVYYGDEIGMQGRNDPLCRGTMTWDEAKWNPRLAEAHRALIALRREHPALRRGNFETLWVFNAVYAFARQYGEDAVIAVFNPRQPLSGVAVPLGPLGTRAGEWEDALLGNRYPVRDGKLWIERLDGCSALVLRPGHSSRSLEPESDTLCPE